MSKLSFRARHLDYAKPIQVLRDADVPDLNEVCTINRGVPKMPTGMEKEEESEHHLQRAISAQQAFGRADDHVIPTPEVFPVDDKFYDELYPPNYKIPRQLVHIDYSSPSFDQDYPDYDIDTEDEEWLIQMKPLLNLSEIKFEEMIRCLEKNSGNQKVIDLNEAKALLKGVDESVQISVYDYWLNKKLNVGKSLIPMVKTEKRDGTSGNNPYIAFRRRTEKMQTRKNRKNDHTSYEKMFRLRHDFMAVQNLLTLVKQREAWKYDYVNLGSEIFEARFRIGDFDGRILKELTLASRLTRELSNRTTKTLRGDENVPKKKRTKRPKNEVLSVRNVHDSGEYYTSEDENSNDVIYQSSQLNNEADDADNPDGMFSFKRKKGCHYHAPKDKLSGWPWDSPEEGGLVDKRFCFNPTSLSQPPNYFIGFARRRIGRGGRIIFDRIPMRIPEIGENSNDDDDSDIIHYKPSDTSYDFDIEQSIEFNARHFDEDDSNFLNSQLKICYEENSLEKQLYQYNEKELISFMEQDPSKEMASTEVHFLDGKTPPSQSVDSTDDTPFTYPPRQTNSSSRFVKPIDVDLANSILNSISTLDTTSTSSGPMKNDNEMKDSFSATIVNEGGEVDDILIEQIDFLNSDVKHVQTTTSATTLNKFENFSSKSSNYSTETTINNGSDHFNSSGDKEKIFSLVPSNQTNTECQSSSSEAPTNTSSTTLLNQNQISSFPTCLKLKLTNNQSSPTTMHPTDVT